MPTFTLSGFQVSRDTNDDVVAINAVDLAIITPAAQTTFSYTIETPATADGPPVMDILAGEVAAGLSGAGEPDGIDGRKFERTLS